MRKCVLPLVLGCSVLTGCSTSAPVAIDGEDNNVSFPEGEITVALGSDRHQYPGQDYVAISAGYTRSEGRFEQSLTNNEFVRLDSGAIYGPATLDNEARLDVTYLRGVYHSFTSESLEWYGGGGLGYLVMDLASTAGNQRIMTSDSRINIHALLGLAYHFTPTFGIEGNISLYPPFFSMSDSSSLLGERVQFFVTPTETLRLFAGYRRWSYSFEQHDPVFDSSDIRFVFSGPTAGVMLRF